MAKLKVRIESNAFTELIEAADFYQEISNDLAVRLLKDFDTAIEEISKHPQQFRVRENSYRAVLLTDFPYLIYYRSLKNELIVVAVINAHRSNKFIKKRLKSK
ncbi:MAG: type II toxin-antitoxin system RelE/ParE family toxin [Sphingobacteriales bacterium JAD_PAG50586_3]|nr:MAG: type II toxin-antitoxin system RelE/ParE family toxin [Sphingobacteriales bacterium JAD_PAG50586_3]